MTYKLTKAERETHVWWDEENEIAHVYTASPKVIRKLDKLCVENPDTYKCRNVDTVCGAVVSKDYYVDPDYIFKKPISQKQREASLRNLARRAKPV